jgi:hypothetical protein
MDNPNCSLDSIFTRGKIPKSKATVELVEKLVMENKIHTRDITKKKKYYVEEETDWVKELGNIAKDIEQNLKEDPTYDNKLSRRMLEFLKLRVKVLTSEGKKEKDVDIRDTLRILYLSIQYHKNPNRLAEFLLLDSLYWAIIDDKYYLTHQLHSNPKNVKRKFHKAIMRQRRSVENLLDMKKKGALEYGLVGKDFKKNMAKLTDDPNVWYDRFYAELNRTLYKNSPELRLDIEKKILDKTKLKPNMPDYENRKKLLDAQKKAFPDVPVAVIFEMIPKTVKEKVKRDFEEMGWDFDLFEKQIKDIGIIKRTSSK